PPPSSEARPGRSPASSPYTVRRSNFGTHRGNELSRSAPDGSGNLAPHVILPIAADVAAATIEPPPAMVAPARNREEIAPRRPPRGEISVSYSLGGGDGDWGSDAVIFPATITLGIRLFGVLTPFVGAGLGYGVVDQRLLTRLTV